MQYGINVSFIFLNMFHHRLKLGDSLKALANEVTDTYNQTHIDIFEFNLNLCRNISRAQDHIIRLQEHFGFCQQHT